MYSIQDYQHWLSTHRSRLNLISGTILVSEHEKYSIVENKTLGVEDYGVSIYHSTGNTF